MHTQKIVHLLMKEVIHHITKNGSQIVILDMEEYSNLMRKLLSPESKERLQEYENSVKKLFASVKAKQVFYMYSVLYSNTVILYPRLIEYNGKQVISKHIPLKIDIRFDRDSIIL